MCEINFNFGKQFSNLIGLWFFWIYGLASRSAKKSRAEPYRLRYIGFGSRFGQLIYRAVTIAHTGGEGLSPIACKRGEGFARYRDEHVSIYE